MTKSVIAVAVLSAMVSLHVQAKTIEGIQGSVSLVEPTESLTVNGIIQSIGKGQIDVKDFTINSEKGSFWIYGELDVKTANDFTVNAESGNAIFLPDDHVGAKLNTNIGGTLTINSKAGFALKNESNGIANIKAKNIVINAKSEGITNNGTNKITLTAENIQINTGHKYGVTAQPGAGIELIATNDISIIHTGTAANGGAIVNKHGDVLIKAQGNTIVKGDIVNYKNGTGMVDVTFNGAGSSFTGAVINQGVAETGGTSLAFTGGSQWTVTGDSDVTEVKMIDSTIDTNGHAVTANKLDGNGTVKIDIASEKLGSLTVKDETSKAKIKVDMVQSADAVTPELAKKAMASVSGAGLTVTGYAKEGLVNGETIFDSTGVVSSVAPNTLMQSSLELASAAPLALNRIMLNDVRKRLGDIRTTEGTHGVWARYDGGKLTGEGGLKNEFNTIQVGIDTVPLADSARMGVAFSYTDSDAEYARGDADMKAYSIAMYGTKMFDNGMFFDVIGRMGTADTDMMVDGKHKGTMDNVVLGVSGEVGWRFDVNNMLYVEPQAEMTYSYVNSENLKLGTASYEVDSVNSLMGRLGFAAGLKCPSDRGNVYVRASAVHEFLGDSKISGQNGSATNVYEIDGEDTWVEYGIGANLNLTKSTYVWADVERTSGGALDEDWRATVGVRYAW